jgi:hypothetical protein
MAIASDYQSMSYFDDSAGQKQGKPHNDFNHHYLPTWFARLTTGHKTENV